MKLFPKYMKEYKNQLEKGIIQKAYRKLMRYIGDLRLHFKKKYPDYFVSGSLYYGFMDMTYFAFTPESLKNRKLRIAIVFLHKECRFEVWLVGYNKGIQKEYWELFRENNWNKYKLVENIEGVDSIVEYVLVSEPNFGDLNKLSGQIEERTMKFIREIQSFLSLN